MKLKEETDRVRLNLPQFYGHPKRGYYGPGGVFDGKATVRKIFQGIKGPKGTFEENLGSSLEISFS
jgi:hypothetical protein